ncbi:MAG: TSUP family transporter [Acidimicrobiales bacterium]
MSTGELVAVMAVVLVGAVLQGSVGFGMNVVSAPVVIQLEPDLVPGPLLLAAFFLTLFAAIRERTTLDISGAGWIVVGRVPGSVLGALAVAVLSTRGLSLALAAIVLSAVVASASGVSIVENRGTMFGAGAVAGFSSTTTSVGGPPIALVLQGRSGPELRSTLGAIFVIGVVMSLTTLALTGEFGTRDLELAVFVVPAAVAGFALSGPLRPLIDRGHTRPAVLAVSALAATILLVRVLVD